MHILAIGNSFSEDATRYLHGIARADGVDLQIANLYIGGCPLSLHYQHMKEDARAYELQYNGELTHFRVTMDEALRNRPWDVITLQQVSSQSTDYATYQPYLNELVAHIRALVPAARIYIHQTWAYEEDSAQLHNVAKYAHAADMLRDAISAYEAAASAIDAAGIIPSGALLGELVARGVQGIYRDTYHASLGLGRYAIALLWYRVLCECAVVNNAFCDFDQPISAETIAVIKDAVETVVLLR